MKKLSSWFKLHRKRMLAFSCAFIILISVFSLPSYALDTSDIKFNEYFKSGSYNYDLAPQDTNISVAFDDTNIYIHSLSDWPVGVHHIAFTLTVADIFSDSPMYTKFYMNGISLSGYFQGESDLNYCYRTDTSNSKEYGVFNYSAWGYNLEFDYNETFNRFLTYTFSLYIYNGDVKDTLVIQIDDTDISALSENQKDTNTITGGWESSSDPDTGSMDEAEGKEESIRDNAGAGFDSANNLFGGFSLESDGNIAKGLLACTIIVNEFLGIEGLNEVVNFSLILGVIAFVLGSAVLLGVFANRHSLNVDMTSPIWEYKRRE